MKPLLVLARIVFVGCLWSIIFTEGVRVIMLENWRFDIFWPLHWVYAWTLWSSGWVIDTSKEWAFILIIISFIPLWLTGWIALSMVNWERLIYKCLMLPISLIKGKKVSLKPTTNKTPVVVKKKSYKEIRPTGHRAPIRDYADQNTTKLTASAPTKTSSTYPSSSYSTSSSSSVAYGSGSIKDKVVNARETFSHSLFNLDNEEDDFDLDFDTFEKSDIFKIDDKKSDKKVKNHNEKKEFDTNKDDTYDSFSKKDKYRADDETRSRHKDFNLNDDEHFSQHNEKEDKKDRAGRHNTSENKKSQRRENNQNSNRSLNETNEKYKKDNASDKSVRGNNPIIDVLTQKGYDVISGITVKNTIIDFLGVSEDKICLCLVDKEVGDWLADEERFNNEEPLWFSENSHRISPVRKASLASDALSRKLEDADFDIKVQPYVIIQMGNIINAEDMFEIWEDTNVEVTRINRGSPKEIKLFSKTVGEVENKLETSELSRLKKLLRGTA